MTLAAGLFGAAAVLTAALSRAPQRSWLPAVAVGILVLALSPAAARKRLVLGAVSAFGTFAVSRASAALGFGYAGGAVCVVAITVALAVRALRSVHIELAEKDVDRVRAHVAQRQDNPFYRLAHGVAAGDLQSARADAERLDENGPWREARLLFLAILDLEAGDVAGVRARTSRMRNRELAAFYEALAAAPERDWASFDRHRERTGPFHCRLLDAERLWAEGRRSEAEAEADRIVADAAGVQRLLLQSGLERNRSLRTGRKSLF